MIASERKRARGLGCWLLEKLVWRYIRMTQKNVYVRTNIWDYLYICVCTETCICVQTHMYMCTDTYVYRCTVSWVLSDELGFHHPRKKESAWKYAYLLAAYTLHVGPVRSKGIVNCQVTFAKTPCPATKGGLWQRICVLRCYFYFPVPWSSVMTPLSLSLSLSVYIYMHIHIQIYAYIYIPLSRLVSGDLVLVIAN